MVITGAKGALAQTSSPIRDGTNTSGSTPYDGSSFFVKRADTATLVLASPESSEREGDFLYG